ncbi:WD40/YVTN/BNR-like repeat-containing protein [Lacibacter sp. H407]|uniref:WD40/YVTN/BNR-like repeat-containing protein n=1 Tax=Lacibacter sp. H407 TaxID=3133423 RepID=UPI0030C43724
MKIYLLAILLLFQSPFVSPIADRNKPTLNKTKPGVANIVFKSTDGGQTWKDISEGLPEKLQDDGTQRDGFFANESGFYVRVENGIYQSKPNSTAPFWGKEIFPDKQGSIAACKSGLIAYNNDGQFLQKLNGTNVWLPVYTNFQEKGVRTVFETTGGAVFIGCNNGLFRSTNSGKTWKQVQAGGWAMKLVELNGVLLATSHRGIIRSTDAGENWELVISEGGVGIDVAGIEGGFAAITFNTQSNTRRIRTSYDGGKTWQPIDAGFPEQTLIVPVVRPFSQMNQTDSIWNPNNNTSLPKQAFITSIVQVGENFYCGHPDGIFKTADNGKTWKLILPSIENKVFNLSVSNGVIYAIPRNRGC